MPVGGTALDASHRCVLDRIVVDGDGQQGILIGIHDERSNHAELLPVLRQIADGRRIVAPRSARWAAMGGDRYSWFSRITPPFIEPIGFGDSLIQLETLALELSGGGAERNLILYGIGQGATMALALAALWPELFESLVIVRGDWPEVPGWPVPDADMADIRVLLISCPDRTRETLLLRKARITDLDAGDDAMNRNVACRAWLAGDQ